MEDCYACSFRSYKSRPLFGPDYALVRDFLIRLDDL